MNHVLKKGICYMGLFALLCSMIPMSHKITVSAEESYQSAIDKAKKEKEAQPELPKVEKTTLGDLSVLADLKASMAAEEKPAKAKKATKKAAEKAEEVAE